MNDLRLIREGKIVGYQQQQHGIIFHRQLDSDEWRDIRRFPNRFIPHDAADAWTGLLDKNGQKVWENDKLKCPSWPGMGLVVWSASELEWGIRFILSGTRVYVPLSHPKAPEVVGNVWEE